MTDSGDGTAHSISAPAAPMRRVPIHRRLGTRFVLVLAVALLPIGTVSAYMTAQVQARMEAQAQAALLGETLRAATPEIGLIQQARGLVAGLATVLRDMPDDAACQALMQRAQQEISRASLVSFIPATGRMTCSSTGQDHDFSGHPLFDRLAAGQGPDLRTVRQAPLSGMSVLAISHPVSGRQGEYLGHVSVFLPHGTIEQLSRPDPVAWTTQERTISFLTFDGQGEVLTAGAGVEDAGRNIPRDRSLLSVVGQPSSVFRARSVAGEWRNFAVVRLVDDELYLLGSWAARETGTMTLAALSPYLPTALMLIVGLIVASWASERLVTRHVRLLNRWMARFAAGDRHRYENRVRNAPAELMALGQAFSDLSRTITRGEAELENMIHQREVLLREVHHRVKNNMQLMASIMSLQRRNAATPEARRLIKGLQDRMISLATIHRGLYQTSGLADVRADELLGDIIPQIVRLALPSEAAVSVITDLDVIRMTPDQAVPMALFLTEAVGKAGRAVATLPPGTARVGISFRKRGEQDVVLRVAHTRPAGPAPETADEVDPVAGLGMRLLHTFAGQLGGSLESGSLEDEQFDSLRFALRNLSEAEVRPVAGSRVDPAATPLADTP